MPGPAKAALGAAADKIINQKYLARRARPRADTLGDIPVQLICDYHGACNDLLLDIQLVAMTPQFMIIYLLMKYRMSYTVPVCLAPAAICYYIIVRQSKHQHTNNTGPSSCIKLTWFTCQLQASELQLRPRLCGGVLAVRYLAAACQSWYKIALFWLFSSTARLRCPELDSAQHQDQGRKGVSRQLYNEFTRRLLDYITKKASSR